MVEDVKTKSDWTGKQALRTHLWKIAVKDESILSTNFKK
jgi:hypothetical protein